MKSINIITTLSFILCLVSSVNGADAVEGLTVYADPSEIHIGYRWMISGDDNLNASCTVRFRKLSDPLWKEALNAWRFHEYVSPSDDSWGLGNTAYKKENRFAGSVFWVEPGQDYEIELTLHDPDGVVGTNPIVLNTTTWREMIPNSYGRKLYVVPGSGGGTGTIDDPFQGLEAAHEAAQPGDIFYIANGTYSPLTITKSGVEGEPICFIGPPDRSAEIDGGGNGTCLTLDDGVNGPQYLIIERFTLRNAENGVLVGSVEHLKFRHNIIEDITNHGYKPIKQDVSGFRQSVMDNWIVGDEQWVTDKIGSSEGIEIYATGSIVCHNFIEKFADGVSICPKYSSTTISPYGEDNNCYDVYGNNVTRCGDDGLEIDYIVANARIWRNVVTNCRMGVSNQPLYGGPCYIFRNEIFCLQDESPGVRKGSAYKLHNGASGSILINNTSSKDNRAFVTSMFQNSFFRNNIFMGTSICIQMFTSGTDDRQPPDYSVNDWDYDAFRASEGQILVDYFNIKNYYSINELAAEQGVEIHGMEANYSDFMDAVPPDVFNEPGVELDDFDLSLTTGAPEINAGAVLPNINDPFVTDGMTDIGFLEYDQPRPQYGPRPVGDANLDFEVDQTDLTIVRNVINEKAEVHPSCDVFIDGCLDMKDLIFVRNQWQDWFGDAPDTGAGSVVLELFGSGGAKEIQASTGESFQLSVMGTISEQCLAGVSYQLATNGKVMLTDREFGGCLEYVGTQPDNNDLSTILDGHLEVGLDHDPWDGDGLEPGCDVLVETLTLVGMDSGTVEISISKLDAVYTSTMLPEGGQFEKIECGTPMIVRLKGEPVGIDDKERTMAAIVKDFRLYQNYPNPFNQTTIIEFDIPDNKYLSIVEMKIMNIEGQIVHTLIKGLRESGHHFVRWDGRSDAGYTVTSGVYYCIIKVDNEVQIQKMMFLK